MNYKYLVIGLMLASLSVAANANVITFDDAITTDSSGFSTQGYNFDVLTNHYHLESTTTRYGTNSATTSLIIDDFAGDNSLSVSSIAGTNFDLSSFDIISAGTSFGSTTVSIVGALAGGGTLSYTYNDSDLNNFETVNLGWSNLTSVTFNGFGNTGSGENFFRLDNLNVAANSVPEPASLLLLGLGLAGIGFTKKKKSS